MESAAPPGLRANLRAMPPSAWVLFAGSFINRLGTFVLPFLTLYLTGKGYSAPQAGLAIACYGLGGLLSQATGGLVADRLGRRNAIALSMFGASAMTLALWRATSLAQVYPLTFGLAAFGELYRPAAGALIADMLPSEQRVTAFTLYRLTVNVGWAFALAIGGFIADRNFAWAFVGDAITSASFGIIALLALPHGVRTAKRHERHLATARASIVSDRGFLLFLAAVLTTGLVYSQNVSTLPLHIRDAGYAASTYGLLQALNGVLVVVFELLVISWTQRFERFRMIALGNLFIGLGFASLLVAVSLPGLVVFVLIWTLGEMIESPLASAVAADRAPVHARGRYQSAFGSMFGVAWMLGPMFGTALYQLSPDVLWVCCGLVGAASASLALAAGRHPAPELAPVDAPPRSG